MEVIYTNNKEEYIHYDHFLIVLNKCVMPRKNKKKKSQKDDTYKEIIIKSTGKEENLFKKSNFIEVIDISIKKILEKN